MKESTLSLTTQKHYCRLGNLNQAKRALRNGAEGFARASLLAGENGKEKIIFALPEIHWGQVRVGLCRGGHSELFIKFLEEKRYSIGNSRFHASTKTSRGHEEILLYLKRK